MDIRNGSCKFPKYPRNLKIVQNKPVMQKYRTGIKYKLRLGHSNRVSSIYHERRFYEKPGLYCNDLLVSDLT